MIRKTKYKCLSELNIPYENCRGIDIVIDGIIETKLSKKQFDCYCDLMFGQTRISEGAYASDVENALCKILYNKTYLWD